MEKQDNKMWFICSTEQKTFIINDCISNIKMTSQGGDIWSRSCGYKTKEDLIIKEGVLQDPCKECGCIVNTDYRGECKKRLIEKNVCFNCDFWLEKLKIINDERLYVIDGQVYYRKDNVPEGNSFVGFGGHKFRIRRNGSEEIIETRNLWHNGKVPNRFLDRIVNNAEFVK